MKLRNYFIVSMVIVYLSNLLATPLTRNNFDLFLQPLQMTSAGLECFFTDVYNTKGYAQDFFPHNFSHLIQFLEHGKQTNQNRDYTKATLSLFSQRLKGCEYTSADALNEFLVILPHLVGHHFVQYNKNVDQKKQAVTQILYQEFLQNFSEFKENPPLFFDKLSTAIVTSIDPDTNEEISTEYLQQTIIRFVETGLSKILWDATDPHIWENVKRLSNNLVQLSQHGIIREEDDLNDLAWSLIHRLCYFIEITGSDLPIEFYEQASRDLRDELPALLMLAEQEQLAETKRAVIERAIIEGIARQQAKEHGFITETLQIKN